jgi:hypothetical protein
VGGLTSSGIGRARRARWRSRIPGGVADIDHRRIVPIPSAQTQGPVVIAAAIEADHVQPGLGEVDLAGVAVRHPHQPTADHQATVHTPSLIRRTITVQVHTPRSS